jgi:phage shock protein C
VLKLKNIKLTRSRKDKQLSGVLGGFAALLNIDSSIIRVLYVLIAIFTGGVPCLFIYIVFAAIIPLEEEKKKDIIDSDEIKSAE